MKKYSNQLWVLLGFATLAFAVACSSDFTTPPVGSTVKCPSDSSQTATVGGLSQMTASVNGVDGKPLNNAQLRVSLGGINGGGASLQDTLTGQTLPDDFFTQTNSQGFIQLDLVNCAGSTEGASYSVEFDIGHASCLTTLTVTLPDLGT